jgi:hypothetical protein
VQVTVYQTNSVAAAKAARERSLALQVCEYLVDKKHAFVGGVGEHQLFPNGQLV